MLSSVPPPRESKLVNKGKSLRLFYVMIMSPRTSAVAATTILDRIMLQRVYRGCIARLFCPFFGNLGIFADANKIPLLDTEGL